MYKETKSKKPRPIRLDQWEKSEGRYAGPEDS